MHILSMAGPNDVAISISCKDGASASINKISGFLKTLGNRSKQVGSSLKTLNAIVTFQMLSKATAPLTHAGFAMAKSTVGITDSINAIAARSGIARKTIEDVVRLSNKAGAAASSVGHSQEQILSAVGELSRAGAIMAGESSETMAAMAGDILNLSKVYGESAAELAGYADMLGDVFGSSGRQLTNQLASLEMAAVKSGGTISEFFDVMKNEGSFLSQSMGMNFEQIRDGLIGVATGMSEPAKKVGSAIQMSIMSLQKPSQDAIKVLNKLGIARNDLFDDSGKLLQVNGENPLVTFMKHFKGADIKELSAIFGAQASMVQTMAAQSEKIQALSKNDWGDAADEVARKAASANGLMGELARTVTILKNKFTEFVAPLAQLLTGIVKRFNDWIAQSERIQFFAVFGSLFASLTAFAAAFALKLKIALDFLLGLGLRFKHILAVLRVVKSIAVFLGKVLLKLPAVFARLNPLVALGIAAFVAWGDVIRQLWGRFGDFLEGLIYLVKHPIDSIQTLFFGFVDDIKAKIQSLVGYLPDFIKKRIGLSFAVDGSAGAPTAADIKASMQKANAARVGGDVNVNFANAPAGMRVTTEPRPGTTLPTNVGYNLLSPAWGMGG